MAAVSASNPNLAASNMAQRTFDMVDVALILRDFQDGAEATTAAETPISFNVEKLKYAKVMVRHAAIGGTVDGSNLWTLTITAADNVAMSNPTTLWSSGALGVAAKELIVPLEGKAAQLLRTAGEDESIFVRITATETGTTAGNLTYGAYITA